MAQEGVYVFPDAGTGYGNRGIDPGLLALLNNNGGFGGNGNWIWVLFLWMMWGANGNSWGGFGGNNGTGFLANQLNNDAGRDLLLQAINGRADALSQLAQITNSSVETVKTNLFAIQSAIQSVGTQVGMSGLETINALQIGNANLSRQICECCCENRLAIANQTATLQADSARNFAATQLQLAQNHADDRLDICQQTNALQNQAERDTNSILGAISAQNTMLAKEFCSIKEREMQSKIDTQSDIITQLRGQLDNDRQTAQLYAAIAPIQTQVNNIAAKQPNTVPVEWPNLVAVNTTPNPSYGNFGGFGYGFGNGFGNGFFGNGFGGGIVF